MQCCNLAINSEKVMVKIVAPWPLCQTCYEKTKFDNNKVITIIGSSRSDGDTKKLINELERLSDFESIDLNDYKIK